MKEIKVIETPQIQFNNYKTLKRVAAYARVSTKLEMQSSSLALQIKHYAKEIIFNSEYIFAGIYADHGKSGTSIKQRDGLQALLKKVHEGHIDLVLVKSLSRFARNTLDALTIIKETRKLGFEFYFEKEGISSLDPAIDMLFTMMASMAESESESMSQNISWSFQKQAQKGKVTLHKCIGYEITKDKRLVIDEYQAPIIKRLFEMKLNGYDNAEMMNYLNDAGLKTSKGNAFTATSQITHILQDVRYIGQMIYGKTYTKKINNEKVSVENNGDKPKYIIKNHHEPIIDLDIFNQVQEIINQNTKTHQPKVYNPYTKFVYSLMHDKYLHTKVKHPGKPEHDLLENEYGRKQGTPRIYSKTATHVLRKATIALARKFSELEGEFDRQVDRRLNQKPQDKKLKALGAQIRTYKNDYFIINKKESLEPGDRALLSELEDLIIKLSIDYINLEDQSMPASESSHHIKDIKKAISSIELPMIELPFEAIRRIFDVIVVVDPENYVFVINTGNKVLSRDSLKKVTEVSPLLESSCKAKIKDLEYINWKIIVC
jgi:DNA invertase Pin-like site-specific DNA recombinase